MRTAICLVAALCSYTCSFATEPVHISGNVSYAASPVKNARVLLVNSGISTSTDDQGNFLLAGLTGVWSRYAPSRGESGKASSRGLLLLRPEARLEHGTWYDASGRLVPALSANGSGRNYAANGNVVFQSANTGLQMQGGVAGAAKRSAGAFDTLIVLQNNYIVGYQAIISDSGSYTIAAGSPITDSMISVVYSAVLDTFFENESSCDTLLIQDATAPVLGLPSDEIANSQSLLREGRFGDTLDGLVLSVSKPYRFVQMLPSLYAPPSIHPWNVVLSKIGFSADRSQAMAFFWAGCGSLCGYGVLFELDLQQGTWKVVRERIVMIA